MANTVFERFNYTFDSNKFGDAINLSQDARNMLNVSSNNMTFKPWQITDLANGPINRETYYKNPVKNVSISLRNTLIQFGNTISDVTFTAPGAQNVVNGILGTNGNNITNLTSLLVSFISHTNNVSGVSTNTATNIIPTFDSIMAHANENTMMLNKTDGIANAVGGLGAMTSLFIGNELSSNNNLFIYYTDLIQENTTSQQTGFPPVWSNTCSLSATQMQTMNVAFRRLFTEIGNRINDDWYFYQTTISAGRDYSFLNRFSQVSNTQAYLINNLIGTDYLKSKLAT